MAISFSFRRERSPIFGTIYRPVAEAFFRHSEQDVWQPVRMIVDTGADYTLLPRFLAPLIGIDVSTDCRKIETRGVGGKSNVYLTRKRIVARIGDFERRIPVGFLPIDDLPPLLGRHEFLETFRVVFHHHTTSFDRP